MLANHLCSYCTGLDACEQFIDVNDMIRDEDLILDKVNMYGNGGDRQMFPSKSIHNIQQFVANMVPYIVSKRPSAREMNLLKRKAKINSKDQSKHWSEEGEADVAGTQLVETPRGSGPDILSSQKVLSFYHLFEWLPDLFLCFFYKASSAFLGAFCLYQMYVSVLFGSYTYSDVWIGCVICWSHYYYKRMLNGS